MIWYDMTLERERKYKVGIFTLYSKKTFPTSFFPFLPSTLLMISNVSYKSRVYLYQRKWKWNIIMHTDTHSFVPPTSIHTTVYKQSTKNGTQIKYIKPNNEPWFAIVLVLIAAYVHMYRLLYFAWELDL